MFAVLGAIEASAQRGALVRLEPGYGGDCGSCDLSARLIAGARLANGDFRNARFVRTVMARADGGGANFADADFTDAILDDGRFLHARFGQARFVRTRMARADFSGADLSQVVGLTQAQLAEACGDAATRTPPRLTIRRCASASLAVKAR